MPLHDLLKSIFYIIDILLPLLRIFQLPSITYVKYKFVSMPFRILYNLTYLSSSIFCHTLLILCVPPAKKGVSPDTHTHTDFFWLPFFAPLDSCLFFLTVFYCFFETEFRGPDSYKLHLILSILLYTLYMYHHFHIILCIIMCLCDPLSRL